jgi:hypothetical protein
LKVQASSSKSCFRYRLIFPACYSVHFPQEEFYLTCWSADYYITSNWVQRQIKDSAKKGHIKLYICRDRKSNYCYTNKHSKDYSRLFFTSICYYYDHNVNPFSRRQPMRKLAANVCTACQYEKASACSASRYRRQNAASRTLCSLLQILFCFILALIACNS